MRHQLRVRGEAVRRYEAGEKVTAIVADLGVTLTALYRWIHAFGVPLRGRGGENMRRSPEVNRFARTGPRKDPAVVADAVARYAAGESADRVALDTGVSHSTVLRYARAAGVQVRDRHWRRKST